jgi:Fe-S-cluster containining protein
MREFPLPSGHRQLIQIIDAALADASRRSGSWLVCHAGCTQCCVGVFAINQLDAVRLKSGLAELEKRDPARAAAVQARSREAASRLSADFPGDPRSGILAQDDVSRARFEDFANDEICPVLDPSTGMCDLYESRPLTCRTFGPPVQSEDGLGVCELCYHGASDEEIASCEMAVDPDDLEAKLVENIEATIGVRGQTIIAFALRD